MAKKETKRTSPKKVKTSPKQIEETETMQEMTTPVSPVIEKTTPSVKKKTFMTKKRTIILFIIIVIIFAALYYLRSFFVVATVNGQPISRVQFNQELEKQAGKQVMSTLIRKMLIDQEAQRKHVTVSQKEIDDQIKTIEKNLQAKGQKLDSALAMSGLTRSDLEEQIRTQKIIEKIFAKDITVSDKEIDDYIAKYNEQSQAAAAAGTDTQQPQISRDDAREAIKQDKLGAKFKPWLDEIQSKAKITYFINIPQQ